jgi:hypothetical protein
MAEFREYYRPVRGGTVSAHPAPCVARPSGPPRIVLRSATSLLQNEYWQVSALIYLRCTRGESRRAVPSWPASEPPPPSNSACWIRADTTAPHRPLNCGNCPVVQDLYDLRGNQPNPAHGGPGRSRRRRATLFAAVRWARVPAAVQAGPCRVPLDPARPRTGWPGRKLPLVYPRRTWAGGAADRPGQECPLTWIRPARRLATRKHRRFRRSGCASAGRARFHGHQERGPRRKPGRETPPAVIALRNRIRRNSDWLV